MEATVAKLIGRENITDATMALFADSAKIPERFIRNKEVQAAGVVVGEDETFELPVVNMANLLDPELSALETAKLGSASRDGGFFQLPNHGVDEAAMQQIKDSTAQFFSLPLESKKVVAVRGGGFEGFGHHYNGLSSDKLDWAENLFLFTQPVQGRNMELWPANPPTFRHALDRYSAETNLARRLLGFMATDLGVSQEALLGAFFSRDAADDTEKPKRQSMAMHHYPPCRHPCWASYRTRLGIVPHTNGAYVSVEHRVVPDAERGRVTVAMFHDACVQGLVAPLPELLTGGEAQARYRSIGKLEFRKGSARALAEGRRFLDSLRM